jgi:hypothetical protein
MDERRMEDQYNPFAQIFKTGPPEGIDVRLRL